MKVLIVGGGGREHAIAWKIKQSSRVDKIYCAPGNGGTARIATNVAIKATDLAALTAFAVKEGVDLVFVAPDDPLAMGLVDELERVGIQAFGPDKAASLIESSKVFAKDLMRRYHIPTADYAVFDDLATAMRYIEKVSLPTVIKADGLALGKGVIIARTRDEARRAVRKMMGEAAFGAAGKRIVVEEFLTGPELTVLAFTDGKTVRPMVSSRDHKRAFDDDQGPNTGGMGAVVPGAVCTDAEWDVMTKTIFQPTIDAMRAEGRPFRGVIYYGLMLTPQGPHVIEYNARFGDPEAQAVLPLLETDLMTIIDAVLKGSLDQLDIQWKDACSCCVVMASGGYPAAYKTGYPIFGLDTLPADCLVFHAGTRMEGDQFVTSGGRVLGVVSLAETLPDAIRQAYHGVAGIDFQHAHYRRDIGGSAW
ncbi:MAG: phosphoribosylamine--glycine ligase [Saccharofermentanales bacterium]|jgi:phosphoribosylamine--glycine ligase|nr:phosphoribosylamine--glycine ligase [Clostridiaceae bacterium]